MSSLTAKLILIIVVNRWVTQRRYNLPKHNFTDLCLHLDEDPLTHITRCSTVTGTSWWRYFSLSLEAAEKENCINLQCDVCKNKGIFLSFVQLWMKCWRIQIIFFYIVFKNGTYLRLQCLYRKAKVHLVKRWWSINKSLDLNKICPSRILWQIQKTTMTFVNTWHL